MKLLLVDPHQMVRQGLRSLLAEGGFTVCGEAADGRQAVDMARRLGPGVVLMDTALPVLSGAEATRQIRAACVRTRVIALSGDANGRHVLQMIDAGAGGHVLKEDSFEHLVEAIDAVATGQTYYTAKLVPIVEAHYQTEVDGRTNGCTAMGSREQEVLQLLADGVTTTQVAAELGLSAKTVETYRTRIVKKLGVSGMAELTRYAVREGMTSL